MENKYMKRLMLMEDIIAISISLMAGEPSKTYKNPVVNYSLPDPTVIEAEDGYFYLYATEDIRNLPIHRSKDLVNWESVGTAFTTETRPTCEPKGSHPFHPSDPPCPLISSISPLPMLSIPPCRWGGLSGLVVLE